MVRKRIQVFIDSIIADEKVEGDVRRVFRGYGIGSDHSLVVATKWKRKGKLNKQRQEEEVFKMCLLNEDSVRDMYQQRLDNVLK